MKRWLLLGILALGVSAPVLFSKNSADSPGSLFSSSSTNNPAYPNVAPRSPVVVAPSQWTNGTNSPFQLASTSDGHPPMTQPNQPDGANRPIVQGQIPIYNAFTSPREYLDSRITPDWVRTRWPRVSMAMGEDSLTGMRVALVSGPRPADIHGSLTYYFDNHQQLQRITFRGWTGEPSELVNYLTGQLGFTRQQSRSAGLYSLSSWGKKKGVLRLDYPPIIQREATTEQFMVLMELISPVSSLTISQLNSQILAAMGQ
jgi:hypothetical protein